LYIDARVVRGGDRGDDREAEAVSVGVGCAVGRQALEGMGQSLDLVGWDVGAGVGDGERRVAGAGVEQDVDVPVRDVVVQRVLEEVADKSAHEARVAGRRRGAESGVDLDLALGGLGSEGLEGLNPRSPAFQQAQKLCGRASG
jgi:hypothetical protein